MAIVYCETEKNTGTENRKSELKKKHVIDTLHSNRLQINLKVQNFNVFLFP